MWCLFLLFVVVLSASNIRAAKLQAEHAEKLASLQDAKSVSDGQVASLGVELATTKANLSSTASQLAAMMQSHSALQAQYVHCC